MSAVLGFAVERPWVVVAGLATWVVVAVIVALIAGPVIAAAEYEEPTPLEVVR